MLRIVITLLVISNFHNGFSQEKKFDRFIDELNIYKTDSNQQQVFHKDSIKNWSDYELKWIKIKGTYGGSGYCCGGKVIQVNRTKDTLDSESYLPILGDKQEQSLIIVGDRYVIEEVKYDEPQPTSAIHFIYVFRYYRIKDN